MDNVRRRRSFSIAQVYDPEIKQEVYYAGKYSTFHVGFSYHMSDSHEIETVWE